MKRVWPVGLVFLTACGFGSPTPPTVRDSLGITIVENVEPAWGRRDGWMVSETSLLDIGGTTVDSALRLSRPVASTRLDDGTIVVGNAGTQELRWYDGSGRHIRTSGGRGAGRGQFVALEWVGKLGAEAVVAFDYGRLGLLVFDRAGNLQATNSLVMTYRTEPGSVRGVFADSTLLVIRDVRHWAQAMIQARDTPEGLVRGPSTVARYGFDGRPLNSIGTFDGSEQVFSRGSTRIVRVTGRPFGRTAVFALHENSVHVGTQDSYEVTVYDNSGGLDAIIRVARENPSVTDEHIERYKRPRLAGVHERFRADKERELNTLPFPETMPAYDGIIADSEGNLWVADYRPFGEGQPTWTVFDTAHRMLGTVDTPIGLTIHEIGSDYVLGARRDEDGADHVSLYELQKPPRGS